MRDLAEYEEAELVRKKVEACFAAFVTQPEGAEGPTVAPTETKDGKRIEALEPGMIEYLKPGEGVAFGAPSGVQGYADYRRSQLHDIAAGLDLTYELLSGDLSQVNYSSIRAGLLEFWRAIDVFRWHVLIPGFCFPVWKRFTERALLALRSAQPRLAEQDTAQESFWAGRLRSQPPTRRRSLAQLKVDHRSRPGQLHVELANEKPNASKFYEGRAEFLNAARLCGSTREQRAMVRCPPPAGISQHSCQCREDHGGRLPC